MFFGLGPEPHTGMVEMVGSVLVQSGGLDSGSPVLQFQYFLCTGTVYSCLFDLLCLKTIITCDFFI
jgi:hypothetical protein